MLSVHPCPSGEIGKHLALKMRRHYFGLSVQVRPWAP